MVLNHMNQSSQEITKNIFRLSLAPNEHFEFNQFLIVDEKICLIHTGKLSLFNELKGMALKLLDGREVDYFIFSHFEADECGSINEWLSLFPNSVVYCNKVANINLGDFLIRSAKVLQDGSVLDLGERKLRMIDTPHFPHNWDAHMWYEESDEILFSSDFCCHGGISEPVAKNDTSEKIISFYEKGKFIPYGKSTNLNLDKINSLNIKTIAPMHGSIINENFSGDVLRKVSADLKERSLT